MKWILLLLALWSLVMATILRGEEYEYPFPQNIGGEWLRLEGYVEDARPWYVRLATSGQLWVSSGPAKTGEIPLSFLPFVISEETLNSGHIPGSIKGSYGAGIKFGIEF